MHYDLKHSADYTAIRKLPKATGMNEKKVKEWLKAQFTHLLTYTLHEHARKVYPTHYIVHDIDEQWQADLADLTLTADKNKGYHFILTVISIF